MCVCVRADDVAHLTYLLKCGEAEDVRRSHADAWQYGRVLFRARAHIRPEPRSRVGDCKLAALRRETESRGSIVDSGGGRAGTGDGGRVGFDLPFVGCVDSGAGGGGAGGGGLHSCRRACGPGEASSTGVRVESCEYDRRFTIERERRLRKRQSPNINMRSEIFRAYFRSASAI